MIKEQLKNNITVIKEPSEGFISKVQKKMDDVPSMFVQSKFLFEIGLFGSRSAAVKAVRDGLIPNVKISAYRTLIAKEDVIAFLRDKHQVNKEALS